MVAGNTPGTPVNVEYGTLVVVVVGSVELPAAELVTGNATPLNKARGSNASVDGPVADG